MVYPLILSIPPPPSIPFIKFDSTNYHLLKLSYYLCNEDSYGGYFPIGIPC